MTDKFVSPAPLPTPYEREILTITGEECNEIAQRVAKILRFGVADIQEGQALNNIQRMSREMGQLYYMIELLENEGLIDLQYFGIGRREKPSQLAKYLQNEKGSSDD